MTMAGTYEHEGFAAGTDQAGSHGSDKLYHDVEKAALLCTGNSSWPALQMKRSGLLMNYKKKDVWPSWVLLLPSCFTLLCLIAIVMLFQSQASCNGGGGSPSLAALLTWRRGPGERDDDVEGGGKDDTCRGRYVYMYDLPRVYNDEAVAKCQLGKGACQESWGCMYCGGLDNDGMGARVPPKNDTGGLIRLVPEAAWFRTHQFTLEVLFHRKMAHYPCLTRHLERADAFYVPWYVGQDASFTQQSGELQIRDRHVHRLIGWLSAQPGWQLTQGRRHFMVLGRQPKDLSRPITSHSWGMALTTEPDLANVTMLWWEKAFSGIKEIGVPYPTSFHPSSDSDLRIWQEAIKEVKREWLVMFLGSANRGFQQAGIQDFRKELMRQCEGNRSLCTSRDCTLGGWGMQCELEPEVVMRHFASAVFCMQPGGDTPTRKSLFDSMISGCIPVLFSNLSAYSQYNQGYLPADWASYSVFIPQEDVMDPNKKVNVVHHLASIPQEKVALMQATIRDKILPRIIYTMPGAATSFPDATQLALDIFIQEARAEADISNASMPPPP